MSQTPTILITGTGSFAARILFDLAATCDVPTRIVVGGRNVMRLAWLRTAALARANMYGRTVSIQSRPIDLTDNDAVTELLHELKPSVILQAASLQAGAVIAGQRSAWSELVRDGGLSASTVFQAVLSSRVARSSAVAAPEAAFVNACFPDVTNSVLAAMGLPIACGIGNVQILAHAFGGTLPPSEAAELRILAHYQNLGSWRSAAALRHGPNARAWIGGSEISDVFERFSEIQLTPEPVIDISGAAAAPLLVALAHGRRWRGHTPGPGGLPGGYPVVADKGRIATDLPTGLALAQAVRWNVAHEEANGLVVDSDGFAHYTGRLQAAIAVHSPELSRGFHVRDLEAVHPAMQQLRDRLLERAS